DRFITCHRRDRASRAECLARIWFAGCQRSLPHWRTFYGTRIPRRGDPCVAVCLCKRRTAFHDRSLFFLRRFLRQWSDHKRLDEECRGGTGAVSPKLRNRCATGEPAWDLSGLDRPCARRTGESGEISFRISKAILTRGC